MQVNKTEELTNLCFVLAVLERAWGKKRGSVGRLGISKGELGSRAGE